jgi:predicted alpha/beta-fold hydrolase
MIDVAFHLRSVPPQPIHPALVSDLQEVAANTERLGNGSFDEAAGEAPDDAKVLEALGFPPFRPRPPWWGADLQTLRDTLRGCRLEDRQAQPLHLPIGEGASLLGLLDQPLMGSPRALVLLTHGLGGSSEGEGPRRLAMALRQEGFAVLRLNLRGAGSGRNLAPGSYAADCSRDLLPVLRQLRGLTSQLGSGGTPVPLVGAGISLGGTILLNASAAALRMGEPGLDALVCTSSPLDLHACARQFARPRNRLYERWLTERLCRQVLADPQGLSRAERQALEGPDRPRRIEAFDALITAPRWNYDSVKHYYSAASPLTWLPQAMELPATLLLHAADDPWVPAAPALALARRKPRSMPRRLEICITAKGGHNGFHGLGDTAMGCWSDRLTARWLRLRLSETPSTPDQGRQGIAG